jgi:hypothetical protein
MMEWYNSGLRRCVGCGFGFTLMKRGLVEAIPEWQYIEREDKPQASDTWFYFQLQQNDIPVFVDTDLEVRHVPSDWDKARKYYDR